MTRRKTLLALAERVEQATGADRRLDTQIAILLDPDASHIIGRKPGSFPQEAIYGPRLTFWDWACDESKDPPAFGPVDRYTASLDAAMTLVPEGFFLTMCRDPGGISYAGVAGYPETGGVPCASLALAVTAQALRARAAAEDDA